MTMKGGNKKGTLTRPSLIDFLRQDAAKHPRGPSRSGGFSATGKETVTFVDRRVELYVEEIDFETYLMDRRV